MPDPHNLARFLTAQSSIYQEVLTELRHHHKTTHWIWFIFPQLRGLGSSPISRTYAIASLDEATAYLAHPILGTRLAECTQLVLLARALPIREILGTPDDLKFHSSMTLFAHATRDNLGTPDDLKFHSSMTLFAHATRDNQLFLEAIQAFFAGRYDDLTLNILARNQTS